MQLPTDNASFLAVYDDVFDPFIRGQMLSIERDIQENPDTFNLQRKCYLFQMVFLYLNLHKQRIENQQHWQREAEKARKERPEPRLDSRIIAQQLGVEHRATLSLVTFSIGSLPG